MSDYVLRELEESAKRFEQEEETTLLKILQDNRNTEYGQKYHFSGINSIREYKENVTLTDYDDYEEYIERMLKNGENNLITVYPIKYYMMSSGTTGKEKHIPMTEPAIINYARYSFQCAHDTVELYYKQKGIDENVLDGKIFLINEFRQNKLENGMNSCIVSSAMFEWMREKGIMNYDRYTSPEKVLFPEIFMDVIYLKLRFALACENVTAIEGSYVHQILALMQYMETNWEVLVEDIEKGTIHPDIDIPEDKRRELAVCLEPKPERAKKLREEFEKGFDTPIVPRIWKDIRFVMAIAGEAFSKYMDKLKRYIGSVPYHYFIYAASEGIFATAVALNRPDEYVLAPKIGFFEFLPLEAEENETTLETCDFNELKIGSKYELVYTGVSGFYRYRMGDVIEVRGFYHKAPMVKFCYRRKQNINVAGEKMDMESIANSVTAFEEKYNLEGNDFCIYPDEDVLPAKYVVLMEINCDRKPNISKDDMVKTIDKLFRTVNMDYDDCRNLKEIGAPEVHFLKKGAFERYKEHLYGNGKEVGQHKPVRVIDTEEKKKFFFGEIM